MGNARSLRLGNMPILSFPADRSHVPLGRTDRMFATRSIPRVDGPSACAIWSFDRPSLSGRQDAANMNGLRKAHRMHFRPRDCLQVSAATRFRAGDRSRSRVFPSSPLRGIWACPGRILHRENRRGLRFELSGRTSRRFWMEPAPRRIRTPPACARTGDALFAQHERTDDENG